MKPITFLLALCVALFLVPRESRAQWVKTNGPGGGYAGLLPRHDSVLFASSEYGIYRSTDHGDTWSDCNPPGNTIGVWSLCSDGNTVYAGTFSGLFRSSDDGLHWTAIPDFINLRYYTAMAGTKFGVFVNTEAGLYRSLDHGATWKLIRPDSVWAHWVTSIVECNGVLFMAEQFRAYRSLNGGTTWIKIDTTVLAATKYTSVGSVVLAATSGATIRSIDTGRTWTTLPSDTNKYPTMVNAFVVRNSSVYAATYFGIYASSDAGLTWKREAYGDYEPQAVGGIEADSINLYRATTNGIDRSSDSGAHWATANNGLSHSMINALWSDGSVILAATPLGISRTSDDGNTWTPIVNGIGYHAVTALTSLGSQIFASTASIGLLRSTDVGLSWTAMGNTDAGRLDHVTAVGANLFAGRGNGIYRSSDAGASWTPVDTNTQSMAPNCFAGTGPVVYAGTNGDGLLASTDFGVSWTTEATADVKGPILAVASHGDYLFADQARDSAGVWRRMSGFLPYFRITSFLTHGDYLFATGGGGVEVTVDNGNTWTSMTRGLIDTQTTALAYADGQIFVGAQTDGVWRRTLTDFPASVAQHVNTASADELIVSSSADGMRLNLQYFTTTDVEHPKLEVCDILGKPVFTTTLESAASGWNRASCALPSLPGGTYLCRVSGGGFSASRVVRLGVN